jgi:uncharacterized protein (TIGR02145 family)
LPISTHLFCTNTDLNIGNQIWMTKNLNVDTFRNGDSIPQAKNIEQWIIAAENKLPAWCFYQFDIQFGKKYGKLYNWYAVNDARGLAPKGYHVPSISEWTVLLDFLGGADVAGKSLKSKDGWETFTQGGKTDCPFCNFEYSKGESVKCKYCNDSKYIISDEETINGNGNNSSGLNFLPGGAINGGGEFFGKIGASGYWWSKTKRDKGWAFCCILNNYDGESVERLDYNMGNGLSVRCLRD